MKITVLFLIAFLGYGCTAKKLAIQHADTLISHQIQKRIPLYSQQKDELDTDIVKFLNQTKPLAQEMVPIVDELRLEAQSRVETQYAQLEGYYQKVARNFSQLISKYMAKLDAKQQKDFFKNLDRENDEILKKSKSKRMQEVDERFKLFLGSMSKEQKAILHDYGDYFDQRTKDRLSNRKKLHEEFRKIYAEDVSPGTKEELFQKAFIQYQDENLSTNKNLEIIKKILPTLTEKQRDHFRIHTQEVKDLLRYYIQRDY